MRDRVWSFTRSRRRSVCDLHIVKKLFGFFFWFFASPPPRARAACALPADMLFGGRALLGCGCCVVVSDALCFAHHENEKREGLLSLCSIVLVLVLMVRPGDSLATPYSPPSNQLAAVPWAWS